MSLVDELRRFDSHERGILLQWAAGQTFRLSPKMRTDIGARIDRSVPEDVFVAMDYTLDWLYAAVRLTIDSADAWPREWPTNRELTASPEDVDLLVAWEARGGPHLVLIEAKGFTGWTNTQLTGKADRLGAIFTEDVRRQVDVHFLLAGPSPGKGVAEASWPEWLHPGNTTHFLHIDPPEERLAVQRCDSTGRPTQTDWTHWNVITRKWSAGPAPAETPTPEPTRGVQRDCARCGSPANWLITAPYNGLRGPGRLHVYCDDCRTRAASTLGTALPISSLDADHDGTLTLLYRCGATQSDPDEVASRLLVAPGAWTNVAKAVIAAQQ